MKIRDGNTTLHMKDRACECEGLATIIEESEHSSPDSCYDGHVDKGDKRQVCCRMLMCVCHRNVDAKCEGRNNRTCDGAVSLADGDCVRSQFRIPLAAPLTGNGDGHDSDHCGAGCHFWIPKAASLIATPLTSILACYLHVTNSLVERGNLGELSIFSSSGTNAFISQPISVHGIVSSSSDQGASEGAVQIRSPLPHVGAFNRKPGFKTLDLNFEPAVQVPMTINLNQLKSSIHRPVGMSVYDLLSSKCAAAIRQ